MSQADDDRDAPAAAPGIPAPARRDVLDGKALPANVQEHLGRKLRTSLAADADKPAFLGDSALPPRFETLIRKLEGTERPAQLGLEAVRKALNLAPDDQPD